MRYVEHSFSTSNISRMWIEKNDPIPWPRTSSAITPQKLVLWGYIKDLLHQKWSGTWMIWSNISQMLASQEIYYQLDVCHVTNGHHRVV